MSAVLLDGDEGAEEDFRKHKPLTVKTLSSARTGYDQLSIYWKQNELNDLDGEGRLLIQIEEVVRALWDLAPILDAAHNRNIASSFIHLLGRYLIKPFDEDRRLLLCDLARTLGKSTSGERYREKAKVLKEKYKVRPVRSIVDGFE
jgi:hypothetical protein